jgi:hypothetical protein
MGVRVAGGGGALRLAVLLAPLPLASANLLCGIAFSVCHAPPSVGGFLHPQKATFRTFPLDGNARLGVFWCVEGSCTAVNACDPVL